MSMVCINGARECDGCMACREEKEYYCPKCGDLVFETVYVSDDGDIVGCENCITAKEPCDVMEEI